MTATLVGTAKSLVEAVFLPSPKTKSERRLDFWAKPRYPSATLPDVVLPPIANRFIFALPSPSISYGAYKMDSPDPGAKSNWLMLTGVVFVTSAASAVAGTAAATALPAARVNFCANMYGYGIINLFQLLLFIIFFK